MEKEVTELRENGQVGDGSWLAKGVEGCERDLVMMAGK